MPHLLAFGRDMTGETKRIAIIQSAYIPWRGFFDFIDQVDEAIVEGGVDLEKRVALCEFCQHWRQVRRSE